MRKMMAILLVLLFLPITVFGEAFLGKPTYLNIELGKNRQGEYENITLSWKDSVEVKKLLAQGKSISYEVDVKHNGSSWHSEKGKPTVIRPLLPSSEGLSKVTLSKDDFIALDELDIFRSNYSFRIRYLYAGSKGKFSTYISIGLKAPYKNAANWAVSELNHAVSLDLISEKISGDMKKNMTREEIAEVFVRGYEALGLTPVEPRETFNDTNNPYVLKAATIGLVQGTGKGGFSPGRPVKREEVAVILSRFMKLTGSEQPVMEKIFKDEGKISSWAKDDVAFVSGLGLMKGDTKGKFHPKSNLTRQEGVILVLRGIDKNL